jgi:alpha-galactosidase
MLEVGNGMTQNEDRAHFSLWCIFAAPLIAGNDITKMTQATDDILTNKEVIAVDQDKAGHEGYKYSSTDSVEVYVKPLSDNNWAVCFLNRSHEPKNFTFNWKDQIITDTVSNETLDAKNNNYHLRDLWKKQDVGDTRKPFKATIGVHDVVMLKLTR